MTRTLTACALLCYFMAGTRYPDAFLFTVTGPAVATYATGYALRLALRGK